MVKGIGAAIVALGVMIGLIILYAIVEKGVDFDKLNLPLFLAALAVLGGFLIIHLA